MNHEPRTKKQNKLGFTLVELIVVFSIIAILSSIGLAGFSSFSKEQTMKSTVEDIKSILNTARSYTYSQLNSCGGQTFSGYQVMFCYTKSNNAYNTCSTCRGIYSDSKKPYYELDILCDGVPNGAPIQSKKLPTNITINAATCKAYHFQPITNVVTSSDGQPNFSVSYDNSSFSQTVNVTQLGVIK